MHWLRNLHKSLSTFSNSFGGNQMRLKKIQIKNWQCFSFINVSCRDFLVFIGESNTGKSALMKAILYFFQVRNLHEGDLRNSQLRFELTGTFQKHTGEQLSLRIAKNPTEEVSYFLQEKGSWIEISEESYRDFVYDVHVFYLPSLMEVKYLDYLFEKLFRYYKMSKYRAFLERFEKEKRKKASQGLYRHLFLEMLQVIAEREKSHHFWENAVLLWEEPEFYLNPQEERACYESLVQHTKLGLGAIVSTNSSHFIDLNQYSSLCIFRKKKDEVEIFQYQGKLFSGDEVIGFNMNYWINPDRSELFFAKKVVLVEGQTDKMILCYLAKKLRIYSYQYSVIECGSKGTIPQFIRLLNAFRIPYVVVYDKDNHLWRNEVELFNSNMKNKQIQKMINHKYGHWVEFENDIEEEIYQENRERKNYKNKPFYALETVMQRGYEIPRYLEEKMRKIYQNVEENLD